MTPAQILGWELRAFLITLAAIIAYRLLTGKINTQGLLLSKDPGSDGVSPGRVQLLLVTIGAALSYLSEVSKATSNALPDVSKTWLYAMGGSSTIYAGLKYRLEAFRSGNSAGGQT